MSFPDPLSLENGFNAANSYTRTSQDASGSRWFDTAASATEPRTLEIKHQVSGKGKDAVDRHLIKISTTKLDTEQVPHIVVVSTTLSLPRNTIVTATNVYNNVANMIDLLTALQWAPLQTALTTTYVDKLLRGEQ